MRYRHPIRAGRAGNVPRRPASGMEVDVRRNPFRVCPRVYRGRKPVASRLLITVLLLAGWGGISEGLAQEIGPCPAPAAAADTVGRKPDLVLRASARADEVLSRGESRTDVRLAGCSVLDTVRVVERRNLPDPVRPGVTYRDVFVSVEILGHLDVECLLSVPGRASRGAAPDSVRTRGDSLLPQLCGPEDADSPRGNPRREDR